MLIGFRFLLGFGVGGHSPSAPSWAKRVRQPQGSRQAGRDGVRQRQALGLIIGPLIALALLGSGASDDVAWRVLLALGANPASAANYLRCKMPTSPRYQAQVTGKPRAGDPPHRWPGLRPFLTSRRWLITLAGTAGCWFLLDYAYYGNTISTPQILGLISPHASTMTKIALQLAIFTVAAVPGYVLAIARLYRGIGHPRLQLAGFAVMAACFGIIAADTGHDHRGGPVPAGVRGELLLHRVRPQHDHLRRCPASCTRSPCAPPGTGSRPGIGKLGAFIGVFLFPVLQSSLGLRGTLLLTAAVSGLRLRAHPRAAEARRAQPGRHRHQHARARHGLPVSADGRSAIGPLTFPSRGC